MQRQDNVRIAPAEGKLGVLIPGMGAVTTTFIAGLEAFKRGLGKPIGSLTQLGAIRLGRRTEARTPGIRDFAPLATMDEPEHDIFIQLMKLKNTLRWMRGEDLITHLGLEYYD